MSEAQQYADAPTGVQLARLEGQLALVKASQAHSETVLQGVASDVRILSERSASALGNAESIRRIWEKQDENTQAIIAIDKRHNGMRNFAMGTAALGAVVVSLLAWIGTSQLAELKELARDVRSEQRRVDERMDRVEIYLAGPKQDSYER